MQIFRQTNFFCYYEMISREKINMEEYNLISRKPVYNEEVAFTEVFDF